MPIRDLPNDVLLIVLAKAARYTLWDMQVTREFLPLIAVCQRWRHLALPIVYADAHYVYQGGPSARDNVAAGSGSAYPCVRTNVYLIASAGCANVVKRMRITLEFEDTLNTRLSAAAKRLRGVVAVWPRVEYLNVCQCVYPKSVRADDARVAANMLIGMFPGVSRLEMHQIALYTDVYGLDHQLAAGYSRQLREYKGKYLVLPLGCVFERLEKATITYWGEFELGFVDRNVQPSQLQHLRLDNKCRKHPWDMFVGNSNGGVRNVAFPNLKSLTLKYSETDHHAATSRHPQLHFPRLQHLDLEYESNACGLLQHAVFPTRMTKFVVRAPAAVFDALCGIELPVVKQLDVSVSSERSGAEGLGYLGRFLSGMRGGKQKLFIHCAATSLLPELVSCACLTYVNVNSHAAISLVMSFVAQLQFLRRLEFTYVTIGELPADLSVTPRDRHERLEPLNSSLQTLTLRFDSRSEARDTVAAAKYLLMRLPKLTRFSAPGVSTRRVLRFARKYSRFYPHLESAERVFRGK